MAFAIRDKDRSAFGLGWEYKRRGLKISDNPFDKGHWKWEHFREGFQRFKAPKDALYDDPTVIPDFSRL